jgi:hypothetical protein
MTKRRTWIHLTKMDDSDWSMRRSKNDVNSKKETTELLQEFIDAITITKNITTK